MNVASLENCRELYELSGWADTEFVLRKYSLGNDPIRLDRPTDTMEISVLSRELEWELPYYDLGYLLRKLPRILINAL